MFGQVLYRQVIEFEGGLTIGLGHVDLSIATGIDHYSILLFCNALLEPCMIADIQCLSAKIINRVVLRLSCA